VELGGPDGPAAESITPDIHCVTPWSKLDTAWRDVSLDTLLADVETEADYAARYAF
jgi:DMSO/TMAO reductase YedYZ molybdopterin-dependent catalytic subunit